MHIGLVKVSREEAAQPYRKYEQHPKIVAIVAFFFFSIAPSYAQTKGACDIAYEEYLELRKPPVERARKAYDEFMAYNDSMKKDKRGNVTNPADKLKFYELACIYSKASVERAEALVALTPKPERLCLGYMDTPCDTACWKTNLVTDKKGEANSCAEYKKLKK